MSEMTRKAGGLAETDIAIVGMAAHLPGAADIAAFWANLRAGVESIRVLSREELLAAGESPSRIERPNYVPSAAILDGFENFDADFFGFSPKEAAILDPQHRQFLEVAWEALENAGHPPEKFPGAIGVWAGCGMGSYFYFNLCSNPDLVEETGMFLLRHTGNDKDFLATRASHILDLKGPSVNVQTACSTSLVAIHYAAQALLSGECDMALAGGVTIELPHARGYLFQEGEILSPDGHCHAFDHRAQGTVFGSGAGCVVLRRAVDAIRDGDHIWAILKGTAINNDGAAKAGYLAPSVDGQSACIAEAQAIAGVTADTVTYIECHGTGTYLGDPIEVAALTEAFRETTDRIGHCGIGSVKTNIGHLDTAAGVASLIKVALSLHHRELPPSLGFEAPNPSIDFETSPFHVNDRLKPWDAPVLRAGVNSLGVGGTNAHAVLEEAPAVAASEESDWPFQPLVLSARSKSALDGQAARLAAHLRDHPDQPLADVAWTLKEGRRAFEKRRVIVAQSHAEAASLLEGANPRLVFNHDYLGDDPETVFMFPGGGAQFAGMARDLYETEPVFRDWMERGLSILQPQLDYDIRALWLPAPGAEKAADEALKKPSAQLPLIMITEYALAKLYESWGLRPAALIGHSMGENTAAALAGVMSFEDCIGLVLLRGRLFDTVPAGGMLSVPLSQADLARYWADDLDMASVNAPGLCVVSGPDAALDALAARLLADEVETQRIAINIAAHSRMLDPILGAFGDYLRGIRLSAPQIPIISNRTGQVLAADQATSPDYWVAHLRNTVNFRDGLAHLTATPGRVYIEMGPGRALSSLAGANGVAPGQVVPALRHPEQKIADDAWLIGSIARLWACGVAVDWAPIWGGRRRKRVPLPGYAFQRKPYFIAPGAAAAPREEAPARMGDLTDWGWKPHWSAAAASFDIDDLAAAPAQTWAIFEDDAGLCAALATRLEAAGHRVARITPGDGYRRHSASRYSLAPEQGREGYEALIRDLLAADLAPARIVHGWLLTKDESFRPGSDFAQRIVEQGFWSALYLLQALAGEDLTDGLRLTFLTNGAAAVKGSGLRWPEKALLRGPVLVAGKELPGLVLSQLDLELPALKRGEVLPQALVDAVLEEALSDHESGQAFALRGGRRYQLGLRPAPLPEAQIDLPQGAHLLITGGFGGIGLTIAEDMIRRYGARVTLIARSTLPEGPARAAWLVRHAPGDPVSRRILALERLEALADGVSGAGLSGAGVQVLAADVANLAQMQAARDQAEAGFGPVHTVIHAAGMVADGPLLAKEPGAVAEVFAPKLHGTGVLDRVFPDGSIALMVLFSSSSTVTGPAGQVDYVAANEYLNAFAQRANGAEDGADGRRYAARRRIVALDWGIWQGVGMAADSLGERMGRPEAPRVPLAPRAGAMLAEAGYDQAGNRVFFARADAADWIFDGHRTKEGQALLPGTGYLQLVAEAWLAEVRLAAGGGPEAGAAGFGPDGIELRDLTFLAALDLADGETRELRVRLLPEGEAYAFEVQSRLQVQGRDGWLTHATGRVLSVAPDAIAAGIDPAAIAARLRAREEAQPREGGAEAWLTSPQEAFLRFGPRWHVLRSQAFGVDEGLAELSLAAPFRDEPAEGWHLHPALLDLATGWAMGLIAGYQPDRLWVPLGYASARFFAPLEPALISHIRNAGPNAADRPTAVFDITLATPDGRVLAEIRGFTIRRLDGPLQIAPPDPRLLEAESTALPQPSPAEERLLTAYRQGIRPDEGAEAFGRAVAAGQQGGLAQIIVSSLDLPALMRQTALVEAPRKQGQSFERPDLDTDYIAPRDETERVLTGFWQDLLGVGQVGVEDNFFDLGGHSLIAVRLFAMVKKTWAVDFPISVLFEAPTIAACARLIREAAGLPDATDQPQGDGAPGAASLGSGRSDTAQPARRFTHLVQMADGKRGGGKTPFFLVSGMFGNVLNLRHLAQLIGRDRPFYGLQARGLFGEDQPHEDFTLAARDYLAELRQVQPHGPYRFGGFSGGGLIAWEMARQLREAGEEVALLVLLDTPLPMRPGLSRRDRALIKLAELRRKGPGYLAEWAKNRMEWERRKRATPAEEEGFHNRAIEAAFRAALPRYQMTQHEGATVLYRPALDRHWQVSGGKWVSAAKEYVFEDNDLTRFAPVLQVVEVPGDHDSMVLEPNVRVLAANLARMLEALDLRDDGAVKAHRAKADGATAGRATAGRASADAATAAE
ncbi:acyltransferase domain-containing protein [Xinfangfangia sp. D13-10-4-6]|uniref:type I polyketide synthase n=1 Tax=Pseudogemmobacter hezensis TaxID=2737662 RepID=UPI0020A67DF8|nr:type I polyketide synthase [Pseudogemmobacter hezensis]NPD13867.1 acyltransferase domain-containing protein [Pseudogemmobacter hezensis]